MITPPHILIENDNLILQGDWSLKGVELLSENFLKTYVFPTFALTIDGSQLQQLDMAGSNLIYHIIHQLEAAHVPVGLKGFSQNQQLLLELVQQSKTKFTSQKEPRRKSFFERVGINTVEKFHEGMRWISFIGEFSLICFKLISKPQLIPWKSIVAMMEFTGIRALPIIGFLSLLIGIVLTYQIGLQLEYYGANIYIVNFLGLGILREFGPLITAIILAGRTSSAYAAQLGLMQANEELDALKTMGLSPLAILVFPRIIALIIVMPLLTIWSDITGLFGGMLMSKSILEVSFQTFLNQFPQVITISSLMISLIKAPVFAFIIASVGCYHGLRVSGSATSIGVHTTKSVVLSIFLIIIADAMFSVIFSYLGI